MKIRVLQLGSPTGLYGAERWILALIKYLNPSLIETWVGVIYDDPTLEAPLLKEAKGLGFETVRIEAYGKFNLQAVKKLRAFLKKKDIHILHTHAYKQDLIGWLATRGLETKIISTPHGWSKEPDLKLLIYEALNRLAFYGFDRVVPLSREIFDGLCRLPGLRKRLTLIENAVDLEEIKNVKEVPSEIQEIKKRGYFVIGYIGQLIHRKGLDILLKALAEKRLQKKTYLFIVGDGPLKEKLQNEAQRLGLSKRVYFAGFRKDRLAFLKGFDIFVLPSRLEGIPRCLMEAMGMGKPVVASAIEGIKDLIPTDGKGGLLFPPENHQILAQKIEIIYKNPDLRRELGQQAAEIITKRFSAARMARDYEILYQEILEKSSFK